MKIAIVTDSTAYLTNDQYKENKVKMVPLSVVMEKEAFREEVDITMEEFLARVDQMATLPTSSQPTVGDFMNAYQELADEGYDAIISIHISKKLSGTFQNAASVANSFEQIPIFVYDSEFTAAGQAKLVFEAVKLANQNLPVEDIIKELDAIKETLQLYFVVDDLSNLVKGGRLSSAAGALGTLLKIKPILTIDEGELGVFDKIRTQKKALNKIGEILGKTIENSDYPIEATIVNVHAAEKAEAWKNELEATYPQLKITISHLGPVIGVHTGRGALGLLISKQ